MVRFGIKYIVTKMPANFSLCVQYYSSTSHGCTCENVDQGLPLNISHSTNNIQLLTKLYFDFIAIISNWKINFSWHLWICFNKGQFSAPMYPKFNRGWHDYKLMVFLCPDNTPLIAFGQSYLGPQMMSVS